MPILLCVIIHGFLMRNTAKVALPSHIKDYSRLQAPSCMDRNRAEQASKVENVKTTLRPPFESITPYRQFLLTKPIRNESDSMRLIEPINSKRILWLTYVPTGGGLSDQIIELQMALHLARQSGRQLLLPPFLTDGNPKAGRYGCCEVEDGGLCPLGDRQASTALSWSEIIDVENLSERLGAIDGTCRKISADFSQLTLSEFNRCNTRWGLRIREECASDLVPEGSASIHSSGQVIRSPHCLFDATREVNVLRFVDLIATMPKGFVLEKIIYNKNIAHAASTFIKPIHNIAGGGALFACAQLPSQLHESHKAVTRRIATVVSEIQTYLELQARQNPHNDVVIYVSTNNEDMVALIKQKVDLCGKNDTCFFFPSHSKI